MERNQPPIPQKSNSFSSSSTSTGGGSSSSEKLCHRNLSLGSIHFQDTSASGKKDHPNDDKKPEKIDEGEEEENADDVREDQSRCDGAAPAPAPEETLHSDNLITLIDDIDQFLLSLGGGVEAQEEEEEEDGQRASNVLPEIPESTVEKFVTLVEKEIAKHESGEEKLSAEHRDDEPSLLAAVERISKLTDALAPFASNPSCYDAMCATGTVLHRAMSFLEDEFYSLLEECSSRSSSEQGGSVKTKRPPSFSRSSHDNEQASSSPMTEPNPADYFPSAEALARLRAIADAMISAGYDTECRLVFATARRNAFKTSLSDVGFEKIAIDDVQRMGWDQMEGEIAKWIKAFRQSITASLPLERNLCCSVFAGHPSMADDIFYHLASKATHDLLNFSEAVAMARRSAEKLFKVLDMYEALRDVIPMVDRLFPCEGKEEGSEEKSTGGELKSEDQPSSSATAMALKSEMSAVNCRLGEAAVAIFCELENSIKSDVGKNAVPGGAVHPLTRYVMNYLKYACEYIGTLEQIFKDHSDSSDDDEDSVSYDEESGGAEGRDSHSRTGRSSGSNNQGGSHEHRPFEAQLTKVMDLLQSNLDSKAKLYKEVALNNIFLMNNGRYIVQKIKGSPEINELLGDTWCRKRSSDLRQYHKNYQRETWSKVLACFKDDGLTVKGSVHKPQLKERFKSFNALFDEIHRVQSTWVVSDEQLQSELRVSITAVVVPAYRSFLGRFQQYLDAGRQTEKYIKFAPEEVETMIDDLFDGNAASMAVRRRS